MIDSISTCLYLSTHVHMYLSINRLMYLNVQHLNTVFYWYFLFIVYTLYTQVELIKIQTVTVQKMILQKKTNVHIDKISQYDHVLVFVRFCLFD